MSLKAHYVKKSSYDGLPTALYSIYFGDMKVKRGGRKLNYVIIYLSFKKG
jgi:hypothetical protein